MKTFEDYESRKKILLDAYDSVLGSDILPVEETGLQQVSERKNDLQTGRFILAVCGRINSGKSTLLNALLFRTPVLSMDDTPHTAKNTQIVGGEKESIHATFYSREEWDTLAAALAEGDTQTYREFFAEVEAAANIGLFKDELVRSPAVVKVLEGVSLIHEFVTPVAKGGKYTPFVKEVKILHSHQWLRSVNVVDTPGVDDPYKFREDQTKKFVTQAGAVLYVTYAGQAMSVPDFDFLNNYLLHVPREKRVIAVNKVDLLTPEGGAADVESYLGGLQAHPDPSIREVFGSSGSVMLVSALGGLIKGMLDCGLELPGDLGAFYRPRLEQSGHLDPSKHGIDALREMVEERLVKLKGKDILNGHSVFLQTILERKRRILKSELSTAHGRLEDLGKTKEKLLKDLADIAKQMEALQDEVFRQKILLDREIEKCFSKMKAAFSKLHRGIMENTKLDLDSEGYIDVIAKRAAWLFTGHFDTATPDLKQVLDECLFDVEGQFNAFANAIRVRWSQWESSSTLDDVLDYSTYGALADLNEMKRNIAKVDELEHLRCESTGFFQRVFNLERGRISAKAAILKSMDEKTEIGFSNKAEQACQAIKNELMKHMNRIELKLK